jgi:hypothetical protein
VGGSEGVNEQGEKKFQLGGFLHWHPKRDPKYHQEYAKGMTKP